MSFKTIIGQPLAVNLVQRWLALRTTQPLLLYGPDGVGKRTVALEAARALNCGAATTDSAPRVEGCGACLSCRKIPGGKHPDVRVLNMGYQAAARGEPVEKQQFLRIETVLDERRRLYQTPVEGSWKVSILEDAHRLTPDAANALLKVLEEPPLRTAVFLMTPFRDRLFSTLLSRCQPVRFRPLADSEVQKVLTQLPASGAANERLVQLSEGSPGRALYLNHADQIETALEMDALLRQLPGMTPGQILAKREPRSRPTATQRADIEAQLDLLLAPALRELRSSAAAACREAARKVALIQGAQQQLRQNVPPALVYTHLLLQLAKRRETLNAQP